jgi:tetratricopeptide (TPR) repeat protein
LTSVFLLVPNHQLAFVPFAEPTGLHKQAENEFQSLCKQGQSDVTNGRVEAGLSKFKRASKLAEVSDKLKAELYNDIAITLHARGESSTSAEYLEKAVGADPGLIAARSNLALILLESGQKQKAIKVLEEAVKLKPSNNCLVHRLAELNGSDNL